MIERRPVTVVRGTRLSRMYAGCVGLDPSCTIHDRQDSADLINLADVA